MKVISDLHTHSRFAMACSEAITIKGMHDTCIEKGINVLGTGDFTHPTWLAELKESLEPVEDGLFRLRGSASDVRFILSTEVSSVYEVNGQSKRVHQIILMPDFDSAKALNDIFSKRGVLSSDGRPQLSMTGAEIIEAALRANANAFIFPAHIWTPFFGALGEKSGFNSLEEAYEDQVKNIYAIEMGLSSNPPMNWRVADVRKYTLLSNSDMHSLQKMGREMNVFEIEKGKLSYSSFVNVMKDKEGFKLNVKFYPEEGKYHWDGHRQCVVSVDPEKYNITSCPVCGKKLVIGVVHRVNDLADKPPGYVPKGAVPYVSVVPLREVIAYVTKKGETSMVVEKTYRKLISEVGTEFNILVDSPIEKIVASSMPEIGEAISNMRAGKVNVIPGYAGVFGRIDLLNREKNASMASSWKQKIL